MTGHVFHRHRTLAPQPSSALTGVHPAVENARPRRCAGQSRVSNTQPSPTVTCLRRALGHTIKQGSSQCVMNRVMRFEGLAPCTKRRPFCERRALASPDASSRRRLVRRFPKCVTRMYLPRSSALRDSIRVFTGTWRRGATMSPSRLRWHTFKHRAVRGTRASSARGHREGPI